MNNLEPKICGKWDGCGLWLQWNPAPGKSTAFELEVQYRRDDRSEWGGWIPTVPPQGPLSHWGVIPTWKEGRQVQARVRIKPNEKGSASAEGLRRDDANWELASEVTFTRCWALFEISSAKYDQHFVPGTIFHAQVDAAACAYQAKEEIFVKAGETVKTKLFAMGSSGYFQLDHENDFDVRPTFGVRVRNLGPSEEDIVETGRHFTVIEAKKPDPVTMSVTPAGRF